MCSLIAGKNHDQQMLRASYAKGNHGHVPSKKGLIETNRYTATQSSNVVTNSNGLQPITWQWVFGEQSGDNQHTWQYYARNHPHCGYNHQIEDVELCCCKWRAGHIQKTYWTIDDNDVFTPIFFVVLPLSLS